MFEQELQKCGLKLLMSPENLLRIGTSNTEYKHIPSFRHILQSLDNQSCIGCKQNDYVGVNCFVRNNQTPTDQENPYLTNSSILTQSNQEVEQVEDDMLEIARIFHANSYQIRSFNNCNLQMSYMK